MLWGSDLYFARQPTCDFWAHLWKAPDLKEQRCLSSSTHFLLLLRFIMVNGAFHCCIMYLLALFQNCSNAFLTLLSSFFFLIIERMRPSTFILGDV